MLQSIGGPEPPATASKASPAWFTRIQTLETDFWKRLLGSTEEMQTNRDRLSYKLKPFGHALIPNVMGKLSIPLKKGQIGDSVATPYSRTETNQ